MSRIRIDGKTATAVLATVALLAAYWFATSAASSYWRINMPQATSFSSAPEGLRVCFEYLAELELEPVALRDFDTLPPTGTLVIATDEPFAREVTPTESERLAAWVRDGGRLVAVGLYANEALRGMDLSATSASGADGVVAPVTPSPYALADGSVVPGGERLVPGDTAWAPVYRDETGSCVMVRAVGKGEVVWLADSWALSNQGIGEQDNGTFALRVLAAETPVYFDEFHHGFITSTTALGQMGAGGRAALVVGALALLVLLVAHGRRLGPVIAEEPVPEARTLAYVDSLAELYRTAGARREALDSLIGGLERSLARRHGSLALALRRRPDAAAVLERARAARAGEVISEVEFVGCAQAIARARREVETING
jgi:hypothetical protein